MLIPLSKVYNAIRLLTCKITSENSAKPCNDFELFPPLEKLELIQPLEIHLVVFLL